MMHRATIEKGGMSMRFLRRAMLLPVLLMAALSAKADGDNYTLNPGDVLQVSVWKEDGLDREVLVLPDGSVTFPLAGTVQAKGLTASQLEAEIKKRLVSYIPDASVSVSVKAPLGNVVSVIGQVAKPGELVIGHRTSVMQALSMAGGLTPFASSGNIIILHREGGQETSKPFPYDDVIRGRELAQDIFLTPGDVIVVPNASLF